MLRETPSRCLSSLSFLVPLSPPPVLSTRVCDASSLLIPLPLPSSLPPDRSVSSRKLFPDLSSKARERFESIHVSPYPDDDQSVIPSSPPLSPLPRAEKRRIWRRRGSLPSSQLNLEEGFLLIEIEDFLFSSFFIPSLLLLDGQDLRHRFVGFPSHDDGRLACQDECSADTLLPIGTWRHWKHVTIVGRCMEAVYSRNTRPPRGRRRKRRRRQLYCI